MLNFVLGFNQLPCLNIEVFSHNVVSNLGHKTHAIYIFRKEECFTNSNLTLTVGPFAAHVADFIVPKLSNCHVLPTFFIVAGNVAEG